MTVTLESYGGMLVKMGEKARYCPYAGEYRKNCESAGKAIFPETKRLPPFTHPVTPNLKLLDISTWY